MLKKYTWDTRTQLIVSEQSQGASRVPYHSEEMPKSTIWAGSGSEPLSIKESGIKSVQEKSIKRGQEKHFVTWPLRRNSKKY